MLTEAHNFVVQLNHLVEQLQITYHEISSKMTVHDEQYQSFIDTIGSTLVQLEQKTASDRAALLITIDAQQAYAFLSELSHQFHAPIISIQGFSKIMLDHVPATYPQQTAHLTQLLNDAQTLNVVNCTILEWLREHKQL